MYGAKRKLPDYPADHKLGMPVPEGGSNCAKCEYWEKKKPKQCAEPHYIEWNGTGFIPVSPTKFCCDFFEAK